MFRQCIFKHNYVLLFSWEPRRENIHMDPYIPLTLFCKNALFRFETEREALRYTYTSPFQVLEALDITWKVIVIINCILRSHRTGIGPELKTAGMRMWSKFFCTGGYKGGQSTLVCFLLRLKLASWLLKLNFTQYPRGIIVFHFTNVTYSHKSIILCIKMYQNLMATKLLIFTWQCQVTLAKSKKVG